MFVTTISTLNIDSLVLPTWADSLIHSTRRAAVYGSIVFKAFRKTLAPQIATTTKDLSRYYIQCGQGAGQWAMSAAGITHNPIQSAVRVAYAELTSEEAFATYSRIRHIARETAMDALVLGLCGVVAVATTIEIAQSVYRYAVTLYDKVHARFNPAPVIVPTSEMAFAATDEKVIALIVEDIQAERYFITQFDQIDSDVLATVQDQVDEVVAQVTIDQIKSARAALVLSVEGDHLAREALAYVVDQAIQFAAVKQPVVEVPAVDELAASLEVPGATGAPKRQRKTSTSKAAEAKPKRTTGSAKAKAGAK